MGLGSVRAKLLRWIAPPGSRRRTWLGPSRERLRRFVQSLARPARACPPLPIFDAQGLNAFLVRCGGSALSWTASGPEIDEPGALRFALGILQSRPELRERFPRALLDGADSSYCEWLCSTGAGLVDLSPVAKRHLKSVFERRPGQRVQQLYDHLPELRRLFPLALTPVGHQPFVRWLLTAGKKRYGLGDEEIWWFLFECAEDPYQGIVDTYLRTPSWQERFPHGLTTSGKHELLAWIRRHYRVAPGWLDPADWDGTSPPMNQPGMNVLGHFCHVSGLRVATRETVAALHRAGLRTSCRDVPAILETDLPERSSYLGREIFDCTLLCLSPASVMHECYPRSGLAARKGTYRIAVWYWELEAVPPEWVRHAGLVQEIWAPSRFIAEAMRQALPIPVVDMPPSLALPAFPALTRAHFELPDNRYLFLFMFDFASVMERKNPLGLIRAFRKAFGADERVHLVIKATRGSLFPQEFAQLRNEADSAGVTLIDRILSDDEHYGLLDLCDCYVSLHRSEGFGLTLAEAMLLGKPVIATGYSGNRDFMTNENSLLVDYNRIPISQSVSAYRRGCTWADPSVDHAAELMRWVFEHPDEARSLGERARRDVSVTLSREAAGRRMLDRLRTIWAGKSAGAGKAAA